jgi:predicted nucleotidyltransferase
MDIPFRSIYWFDQSKNGFEMATVDFMLSKRQQLMLRALILHPDRWFHTNELISIGGPGVGAGRRAIQVFNRSGILKRDTRGNQVLYAINPGSPIYGELRSICMKTFGLADVVASALEPFRERIELAFLFGSVVTGSERSDSDVDLLVVSDLGLFEFGEALERLETTLRRAIHFNLYTSNEWKGLSDDRVVKGIVGGEKILVIGSV